MGRGGRRAVLTVFHPTPIAQLTNTPARHSPRAVPNNLLITIRTLHSFSIYIAGYRLKTLVENNNWCVLWCVVCTKRSSLLIRELSQDDGRTSRGASWAAPSSLGPPPAHSLCGHKCKRAALAVGAAHKTHSLIGKGGEEREQQKVEVNGCNRQCLNSMLLCD